MPAQFDEHGGLMNAAAASGGTIGPDDTDGVVPLHHHAAVGDDEEGGVGKSMVVGAGRPVIAVPPPSSTRNVATTTKSHGSSSKTAAVSAATKYKKAPDAPKRFKSAFIIYSAEKHKEIKEDLAKQGRAEKVSERNSLDFDLLVWRHIVNGFTARPSHSSASSLHNTGSLLTNHYSSIVTDNGHCQARLGSLERDGPNRERKLGNQGPKRQGPLRGRKIYVQGTMESTSQ